MVKVELSKNYPEAVRKHGLSGREGGYSSCPAPAALGPAHSPPRARPLNPDKSLSLRLDLRGACAILRASWHCQTLFKREGKKDARSFCTPCNSGFPP